MTNQKSDAFRRLGVAFAAGGEHYERLRPGYPEQAVSWLLESAPAAGVVVDIGAGTGKLTMAIAERGFDVIAIDPSADMLGQLSRRSRAISTKVGTGECTGLPDDVAELVTTRSYYLNASEAEQLQIRSKVAAYLLTQFGEADAVDLPYRTHCFRAALRR